MGLIAGGLFSRSQYYQGQADAYEKVTDELNELSNKAEKVLEEMEESE